MLGATNALLLPATITGALARSRWYAEGLNGRPVRMAM